MKKSFEYKDKMYTIGFTRRSVEQLESSGFRLSQLEDTPTSALPKFVYGAFLGAHPQIRKSLADEIWAEFQQKAEVIKWMIESWYAVGSSMLDEPEENSGNGILLDLETD